MRAAALAAAFQEDLYIVLVVEESTRSASTFAFAFVPALIVALKDTTETWDWSAGELSPVPLGSAVLVVDSLSGLGVSTLSEVGHVSVLVSFVRRGG